MKGISTGILALFLFLAGNTLAQETNTSPYSRYGLGELSSDGFAQHFGMGGLSYPIASWNRLNISNPATYSVLNHTSFDFALHGRRLILDDGTNTQETNFANFRHFALGVPIGKRWGGAFGLAPYSSVGYDITVTIDDPELGEVKQNYVGDGGFAKTFLGTSYAIINKDSTKLSLGANVNFLFGSIGQTRKSIFEASSGAFNTRIDNNLILADFTYDFGLYYSGYINEEKGIKLLSGATWNVPVSLKAKQDLLAVSYIVQSTIERPKDTLQLIDSISGNVDMPQRLGYGLAIEFSDQLLIGGQYETQAWANYSERFQDTTSNLLRNGQTIRVGMRYKPKLNLSPSAKVWNRAEYRLGYRISNNYIRVGEADLDERAISFGIGLPMSRNISMMNFGIEFGERGSVESNLLKEQFVNVYVGFALSPLGKWFARPKYD